MKIHILFLLIGILIGSALTGTYFSTRSKASTSSQAKVSVDESQKRDPSVGATQAKSISEINAEPVSGVAPIDKSNTFKATPASDKQDSFMKEMSRESTKKIQQDKFLELNIRLGLTPDQQTALQAHLDEEGARLLKMMELQFKGEDITEVILKDHKNIKTTDQFLDEILTPEQKVAQQKLKSDKIKSSAELLTNHEISKYSTLLSLTEDQKDRMYSTLCQLNEQFQNPQWIQEKLASSSQSPDAMTAFNLRAQSEINAVEKIMTPEQFLIYKKKKTEELEENKKLMEKFTPKINSGSLN